MRRMRRDRTILAALHQFLGRKPTEAELVAGVAQALNDMRADLAAKQRLPKRRGRCSDTTFGGRKGPPRSADGQD